MDIVLEFRQCDDYENIFMCPIYGSQDHVMKKYTDHILSTKVSINNELQAKNNDIIDQWQLNGEFFFQGSDLELIEVDMGLTYLNVGSDNSQYIALIRDEKLSHAISLMANKSRVHLIVSSHGPMSDSANYTVVMQQKFGETYLSLIKKVYILYIYKLYSKTRFLYFKIIMLWFKLNHINYCNP